MGEMVASRSMQVLDDLKEKHEDAWRQIEDKVTKLVSALKKIENRLQKDHNSRKVLDHMETMRNHSNKIEDLLETWAVEVEAAAYMPTENEKKKKRWFGKQNDIATAIMNLMSKFDNEMTSAATQVNAWLDNTFPEGDVTTTTSNEAMQRGQSSSSSVRLQRQMYAHHSIEEHSLETKGDVNELISLVNQHPIVCIWGVKGLGKTTIAEKVFIHPQVRSRFNAFAWVSVTTDLHVRTLLQDMMDQLGAVMQKRGAEAEEQKKGGAERSPSILYYVVDLLFRKKSTVENTQGSDQENARGSDQEQQPNSGEENMKEIQRQKKCFIVIDGVLGRSQWEEIRSGFPILGTDTRVLITTEDGKTIDIGEGFLHNLTPLDEDKGWELLKKYVFHGKEAPELGIASKLGKQMVKKCEGLPLAISTLGRALSRKPVIEWHNVHDDVQGFLQRECQSESDERRDDFLQVPSYDHLSYGAKQCFLYLAIFNEDEDVDLEDLSFLWTAEGMVSPQQHVGDKEETIMKTTENNLKNLVSWRMLQERVDELSANGRSKRLCLHNQMRELSLHQGQNEGFGLKLLDINDGKHPIFDSFSMSGTRRLVIRFNKLSSSSGARHHLTETFYLRSLFFLNSDLEYAYLPVRIPDLSEFTLLRILHFVRCKFEGRRLPQGIEKLLNLRYLGLLYCDLDKLPPSISNVQNLQVLNVRAYDDIRITIPNAVYQMVRLKHLRLPNNLDQKKSDNLNLEALHDLETLVGLNADIHDVWSLVELKKLRHLVTHAYTNESLELVIKFVASHGDRIQTKLLIQHSCDFTSPRGSTVLEEVLMCPNLDAVTFSMVLINEFPYCGELASKNLSQIKLIGCKLVEDPMDAMGKFDNLQKLCLGNGAFVGGTMDIHRAGFPKLEFLEFRCLPRLESWTVEEGAMVKLSSLIVTKCPKLKVIPNGLASVRGLKNLEIELPPTALDGGQERNYINIFAFVRSLIIRRLHPLNAASSSAQ